MPLRIDGIYSRSIKVIGFRPTVFALLVNACMFISPYCFTRKRSAKIFLYAIDTNFISTTRLRCVTHLYFLSGYQLLLKAKKNLPYYKPFTIALSLPSLPPQNHRPRDHHIYQCQRDKFFPSQIHQLVIPETWYGPAYPHKYKNKDYDLGQ